MNLNLAFCDHIANLIKKINWAGPYGQKMECGHVSLDLHPEEGYFLSTKKTIKVTDWNGKKYKVTITEID